MRSRLLILLAAVPLAAMSFATTDAPPCYAVDVAGTPDDTTDDLEACELETFFHRAETPAGNVEALATGSFPTFDTNPPAGSVAGGNGGGYLGSSPVDFAAPRDPAGALTFVGTFEGVIDTLDITLHGFYNGYGSTGGPTNRHPHTLNVYLTVDGIQLLGATQVSAGTSPAESANAAEQFDFAITDIARLMDGFGLTLGGEHTVELTVAPKYFNTNPVVLYVYDTTEVPGGIVFNPATIDENATVVDAY